LLLTGSYYVRRYFSEYQWFSEFAEFPDVGTIASLGHSNAKNFQLKGVCPLTRALLYPIEGSNPRPPL